MSDSETPTPTAKQSPNTLLNRFLDGIEKVGNKLPDPAVMFFVCRLCRTPPRHR